MFLMGNALSSENEKSRFVTPADQMPCRSPTMCDKSGKLLGGTQSRSLPKLPEIFFLKMAHPKVK
ncbi:hypothetical protein BC826DRAFT_1019016 [Russula brevipes]|nr:hypothetical protein BC826DRAFT_1019016 [Russula brevipes]